MRRGEIWWARLPSPIGRRPVLLLSRNRAYTVRTRVTVAQISSNVRDIRSEVQLTPDDGMPRDCAVNLDEILTVSKLSLESRITTIAAEKMTAVARAVRFALDLE